MDDFSYSLRGDIQLAHASELRADLQLFVAVSEKNLVIDCARLAVIDPAALAVLLETQRELQHTGRRMRIANPSHRIRRAFEVSGLADALVPGPREGEAFATAS